MIHDDSKLERSLRGHAETQRQLAAQVRDAGLKPQKRGPHDPDFDVAWRLGSRIIVAEVKSLPPAHRATNSGRHSAKFLSTATDSLDFTTVRWRL